MHAVTAFWIRCYRSRWLRAVVLMGIVVIVMVWVLTVALAAESRVALAVETHAPLAPVRTSAGQLVVMSVNMAHGRGQAWSQLVVSAATTRTNLERIGALLREHQADLVSVQEADGPSWWSGGFDHCAMVAEAAGLPWVLRAHHVDGLGLHYGTGVIGRWPMADAVAHTFAPSPPTFAKGFTVAAVTWPGRGSFDLVSVHTDFANAAVRSRQVESMITVLRQRGRPMIIAGDLNSGWESGGATRKLVEALDLRVWQPEAALVTFPTTARRLDWILVSAPFHIQEFVILPDPVSDHLAIKAVVVRDD